MPWNIKTIKLTPRTEQAVLIFILVLWGCFRLAAYGDPRVSIAGNDTITFIEGSQVPLFSAEMMTGRRLLTTNLIYKIFEPDGGYQIIANGSIKTTRRVLQPGFDSIVILQIILSLLGWSALSWFISSRLKSFAAKVLTVLLIPAFAYAPQIADWDSILMSESMTFSLFILQFALLINIVFSIFQNPEKNVVPSMIVWGVVYFFWANMRDTNNYAALVLVGLAGLTLFAPRFRKHKTVIGAVLFGMVLFALGIVTFKQSGRSLISTTNLYLSDIFPHPARVEFMQGLGMPTPKTPEFDAWFKDHGVTAITRFIFAHPGYALEKLSRDFPNAFKQGVQTYYTIPARKVFRARLTSLGEGLHPETVTPFLMGLILLSGLVLSAFGGRFDTAYPWAWIGAYLFFSATITIIPTILGDNWALQRHTIFSIAAYRLSMWIYVILFMDMVLRRESSPPSPAS